MKAFAILGAIAFGIAIVYGWICLVTLAVNYVLVAFGMAPVSKFLVWVCMFLLSVVGSYFKAAQVKT
jgi:hypothetical protein